MAFNLGTDEMLITDDKGNDHLMKILFTYDNKDRNKSYVFVSEKDDEENVLAFSYNEETCELEEIIDDDEYEEVEEVFNTYMNDPQIQDLKEK